MLEGERVGGLEGWRVGDKNASGCLEQNGT